MGMARRDTGKRRSGLQKTIDNARAGGAALSRVRGEKNLKTLSRRKRRALDAQEPGAIVIFDKPRRGSVKGSRALEVVYKAPLAWDSDVRKLVRWVQMRAAQHFRSALARQVEPSGRRKLPPPSKAKDTNKLYGIETGQLAALWRVEPVQGSSVLAKGKVKTANSHKGAILFVTQANKRGVELVSAEGEAAAVISAAMAEWMAACFGDGVATPPNMRYTTKARLPEVEGTTI
jgi:hypothetical protein